MLVTLRCQRVEHEIVKRRNVAKIQMHADWKLIGKYCLPLSS